MAEKNIKLRDRIIDSVSEMKKFADAITANTILEEIEPRLEKLELLWTEFNTIDEKVCVVQGQESVALAFEKLYYSTRAKLSKKAKRRIPVDEMPNVDLNHTLGEFVAQQKSFYEGMDRNAYKNTKVPKVQIEPFAGDYNLWPSFHDLYVTTVHDNVSISNVHTFQILKTLLKGEAAAIIRHFNSTEANYMEAWEKLVERYNKKKVIITSLIKTFMEQRPTSHPNAKELRQLTDVSDEVIRALRAIGNDAESRDPWLINILLNKVDIESRQLWATSIIDKDYPTLKDFLKFMTNRCDALETCDVSQRKVYSQQKLTTKVHLATDPVKYVNCPACSQEHYLYKCPSFKNFDIEMRRNFVNQYGVCYNCLRSGHGSSNCMQRSSYFICHRKHHTLLHSPSAQTHSVQQTSEVHQSSRQLQQPSSSIQNKTCPLTTKAHLSAVNPDSTTNTPHIPFQANILQNKHMHESDDTTACTNDPEVNNFFVQGSQEACHTLLFTALTFAEDSLGKLQFARAILDPGAQSSFVTESCAQRLGLRRSHSCVLIKGLASTRAGYSKGAINIKLFSRFGQQFVVNIKALVVNQMTSKLPAIELDISTWTHLPSLELADPRFNIPDDIDILIGSDVYLNTINAEILHWDGFPSAQGTKFGWTFAGTPNQTQEIKLQTFHTTVQPMPLEEDIYSLMKRFWEIEDIPTSNNLSLEEEFCESLYETTHQKTDDGKYLVKLPFKETQNKLGNSLIQAKIRLLAMERRFLRNPKLEEEYKKFMEEYLTLKHMEIIPEHEVKISEQESFYLPHHAVVKESSTTTKLRVVFDGSCKTTTGVSLNELLISGPKIQNDLMSIIIRFRMYKVVFAADIEKMYRQILIDKPDTDYQRILWRTDRTKPIQHFRLKTVTYGTTSAAYLAIKTILQLAKDNSQQFPEASRRIQTETYVDDILTEIQKKRLK